MFIQTDVCPQAGDIILDLGCGTGELSVCMAELVGPEGKVVAVDPDKERILLAQQSYGEVRNLSFVEGSASNFPGIGTESYDIIFSNYVIHWIPDKHEVFKNMFGSLKREGKIAIEYNDRFLSFEMSAYKVLNPKNAPRFLEMCQFEERAKIEEYCSTAGFHIVTSYDTSMQLVFESIESLLNWNGLAHTVSLIVAWSLKNVYRNIIRTQAEMVNLLLTSEESMRNQVCLV